MVQRTRTRQGTRIGGKSSYPNRPDHDTWVVYTDRYQETIDYHKKLKRPDGSLPPSNFDSTVTLRSPPRLSRPYLTNTLWIFDGREFYSDYTPSLSGYPTRDSGTRISQNNLYALDMVSRSHPFAPVFSIPVAIKEMAELASLFKIATDSFGNMIGSGYLNYRFGWQAFLRDLKTLSEITKSLEYRIRDFNRLLEKGHLRRRVKLNHELWETTQTNVATHSAYGVQIRSTLKHTYSLTTWGTLQWGLTDRTAIPVDELAKFNLAWTTIFDIKDLDAQTVWELIPFSWLVDYFINIGDLLGSQYMRYAIQPYDLCIMRHYTHRTVTLTTSKPAAVTINNEGIFTREVKSRDFWPVPATPTLYFDLITSDRWKVILALLGRFSKV